MQTIRIRGARTHNLRNIDLDLPRERLIVITGLSGSGKSSLAFDTLYAEGQRRYVESLSAYARQFLSMMDKPDVDSIEGLSPAIAIEQKTGSHNPRSTVGTVTEIYDYLRLLYARAGVPRCPHHGIDLAAQTVSQMVDQVLRAPGGELALLLAPLIDERRGEHAQLLGKLAGQGFVRVRIDGVVLRDRCGADARSEAQAHASRRWWIASACAPRPASGWPSRSRPPSGSVRASCAWCSRTARRWARCCFPAAMPAPSAASRCRRSSRACSRSTTPPAPARPATGWATRNSSTRSASWCIRTCRSRAAPCVAGTGATRIISRCCSRSRAITSSTSRPPGSSSMSGCSGVLLYGSGEEQIEFRYKEGAGTARKRHAFEGIVPNLERRFRETDSQAVRDELRKYLGTRPCIGCGGARLNEAARSVLIEGRNLAEITRLTVGQAREYFAQLALPGWRAEVAARIVREVSERLRFLVDVGLDYLGLDRAAGTLSGGEAQRIRLASQVGSGLTGVMYILDEPSIGLHQRDNERLLGTLKRLRDLGNTVIVVEHDADAIRAADHVVDLGPGAGAHGGLVVAQGTPAQIEADACSLTGAYLSGRELIPLPERRRSPQREQWITIRGARGNNLRNVTVALPVGLLTCVTGVSGSGKSTLVDDTLFRHAAAQLNDASADGAGECDEIEGLKRFERVIEIDQNPIGRTPRSNPATYTGLFTIIRELFAAVPEARARGYDAGRFSFNVKGGRCEACQGDGLIRVEMHFLPDVYVPCDVCRGRRYNRETLEILYRGRNIHEVLDTTVEDALKLFENLPAAAVKLRTLIEVGLSYVRLGQNATTLSGGEAQRVKLARELAKRGTGRTLYILDEPTTGLHFHDIAQLLHVLHQLRDAGNTLVVIEHNLDVIKTADYVIDLGPEGGDRGGRVVAAGTPEQICEVPESITGQYLKPLLRAPRAPALKTQVLNEPAAIRTRSAGGPRR